MTNTKPRRPRDRTRVCTEVSLSPEQAARAAERAAREFPCNAPPHALALPKGMIGVITSKWWGARAADLTFGFMEQTTAAMRDKVALYANKWGEFANVRFRWTQTSPVVRISFSDQGYWSYLGTDCLGIPKGKPTMSLQGFTVGTRESEWLRVVLHEFWHALGCPHEQQRAAILARLDEAKTIAYFRKTQGWSEAQVRAQILTPLEEYSLTGASPEADEQSIMCYSFPASITKNGVAIPGGSDFTETDRRYFAKAYPKTDAPPPPLGGGPIVTLVGLDAQGREVKRFAL